MCPRRNSKSFKVTVVWYHATRLLTPGIAKTHQSTQNLPDKRFFVYGPRLSS